MGKTVTVTREDDELAMRTILLAAGVALMIWVTPPNTKAIDLFGLIRDEGLSDPRAVDRLNTCIWLHSGSPMAETMRRKEWNPREAEAVVMRALHMLVNFRLYCQKQLTP